MYTIFLIKPITTDAETGENFYVCGPEGYEHILDARDVTYYCSTAKGDLIRYETYNEDIAAKLTLDAGFVANNEEDVPADLMEQSRYYTWGKPGEPASGDHVAWAKAGKPDLIGMSGPAQIFGPGEARYMSLEEANTIISNL